MNARLYDPVLGRFLGADPYVQMPDYTQSYNRYSYCLNNPLLYTDPSGEIFGIDDAIVALAVAIGVGATIGGVSYSIAAAVSGQGWDAKQFWKSVGFGAISGLVTYGIGAAVGPVVVEGASVGANIAREAGRAALHGFANGMIADMQHRGSFLSSFAAGSLSSLAGSGYMMYGGQLANSFAGQMGFSTLSGGVGAKLTGGNFWEGAATGAMVGLLNHGLHEAETAQDNNKQIHETVEKYNKLVKDINSAASPAIDLAKHFTTQEIAWLRQAGKITWGIGWLNIGTDGFLTYDALKNGQTWGWHAYNTGIGTVGMMGLPGAATATTVNSYVGSAVYFNRMVNWINTSGQQRINNYIIFMNRGY